MKKRYLAVLAVILSAMSPVRGEIEIQWQGNPQQGGLLIGRVLPGSQLRYQDRAIRVSADGEFLLGFGRDETGPVELTITCPAGDSYRKSLVIEARQYDIQRIDGLPPKQVNPPAQVQARIATDSRQVGRARRRDDDRQDFTNGFVWPARGPITGVYGSQRVLNGEPRRPHFGVDVGGPVGQPVYAPAGGIVTLAHKDMYYSGGTLIIDHGHQLSSTFLHLSKLEVEPGERVEQGDLVGRIGATGRATGPHLDWRMNWGKVRLDPQLLVPSRLPDS